MTEKEDEIELKLIAILGALRELGRCLEEMASSLETTAELISTEALATRLHTEARIKELVEGAVVNVIDPPAEEPEKNRYGR